MLMLNGDTDPDDKMWMLKICCYVYARHFFDFWQKYILHVQGKLLFCVCPTFNSFLKYVVYTQSEEMFGMLKMGKKSTSCLCRAKKRSVCTACRIYQKRTHRVHLALQPHF